MKKFIFMASAAFVGSMAYDLFTLGLTKMKQRYEETHAEPRVHKATPKEPIGFKQEATKC